MKTAVDRYAKRAARARELRELIREIQSEAKQKASDDAAEQALFALEDNWYWDFLDHEIERREAEEMEIAMRKERAREEDFYDPYIESLENDPYFY